MGSKLANYIPCLATHVAGAEEVAPALLLIRCGNEVSYFTLLEMPHASRDNLKKPK